MFFFPFSLLLSSCVAGDTDPIADVSEKIEEEHLCEAGTHPTHLQIWSENEGTTNIDTETLCESEFVVELYADHSVYAEGVCEFQRGNSTRRLSYEIAGQRVEGEQYAGNVVFTRGNGNSVETTFSGHCTEDSEIDLFFEWFLSFSTNNGTREHHGVLTSEE